MIPYFILGLALNKWKDNLSFVLDSINRNKINYKSQMNELTAFFTTPTTTIVPQQQEKLYKYKIGDRVRFNLNKAERTAVNFKYSLHYGMYSPPHPPPPLFGHSKLIYIEWTILQEN